MALTVIASAQSPPPLSGYTCDGGVCFAEASRFRNGDFSELSEPIIDPACDCPFPNNIIPRSRLLANGAWPEDLYRANQEAIQGSVAYQVARGLTPLIVALTYSEGRHPRRHLHPEELERLLDGLTPAEVNGRLVNAGSRLGWTALHFAAQGRGPGIVQLLLDSGADVNARADDGRTPLHVAASWDQPEIVRLLLGSGAIVDARTDSGWTPLMQATTVDIFKALQAAGADVRAQADYGRTVLHTAALATDAATVEALIAAGLDPSAESSDGSTPLLSARSPEVFETLRKAGADIHARRDSGFTALHQAALWGWDAATVEALIAAGLDPNAEDRWGQTPLLFAGSRETFEALLAGGAGLGPIAAVFAPDGLEAVRSRDISPSILRRAVRQVGRSASASLVERLRAINPGFAEVPDNPSRTSPRWYPLHYAAGWNEDPAMIAALSTSNVNANTEGRRLNPMALAARSNGNPAVIEAILATGPRLVDVPTVLGGRVQVPVVDYGGYLQTPLYYAALNSSPRAAEIVGVLLGAGADVERTGQFIWSAPPLYAAAMSQNLAALELLIAAGADVNVEISSYSLLARVLGRGRFDCGFAPVAAALRAAGAEAVWFDESRSDPAGTRTTHRYVPGPQVVECATVPAEIEGVSAEVQELINSGADLDAQDRRGFTALLRAAASGKAGDIAALAAAGADVNAATPGRGLTPLHVAVWRRAGLATVQALLAAGADVDAADRLFGATALHQAAGDRRTDPAVVAALLAAGADPNARDNFLRTPSDYATGTGVNNVAVADLLRAAGGTCRSCGAP